MTEPVGPAGAAESAGKGGRVVLADDRTAVRTGFRALPEPTEGLTVVAATAYGGRRTVAEAARVTRPAVDDRNSTM